ncbi:MAG: ELM1/GtrOC1 family putative glycosyltransferase [Candidatus Omnitrophota bacterium]
MKSNFLLDYLACTLFRPLGAIFRFLPAGWSLFFGRRLGDIFYYSDIKHRARCYANIRFALGENLTPREISKTTHDFYRSFGESLIEIFLIPKVDKAYMDKYVTVEGLDNIYSGLKTGKGVILIAVHAGGWELSNIICANFGFPFCLFVKGQDFPRLNELLNKYRRQKGCKIITREGGLKQLVEAFKNNYAIGITLDQGGKTGELVNFFGKTASMSTGGIKLASKYGAPIIPVYFRRTPDHKVKVLVGEEVKLIKTNNAAADLKENLEKVTGIFEGLIRKYPKEYLWTYKIWKYSDQRSILILSDKKAGHLRQSEAVGNIAAECLEKKGIRVKIDFAEVEFKNNLSKLGLAAASLFSGKYGWQGCLPGLKEYISDSSYKMLERLRPDMVISCGWKLAAVNFIVSRESLSKSVVIMRPSILNLNKFDLVIMPRHDLPPKRKNLVVVTGALNLINEKYLKEQSDKLIRSSLPGFQSSGLYIGVLIGGDSRGFKLRKDTLRELINQIKSASDKLGAGILITTSRRTPDEAESLIKQEFKGYPRCQLMVIANEKNIPEAVGGILGLSKVIVSSPESISMLSEAVNSVKPVIVFEANGLSRKHEAFLRDLTKNKRIILSGASNLGRKLLEAWEGQDTLSPLKDNDSVRQALEKML